MSQILGLALVLLAAIPAQAAPRQVLHGHVPAAAAHAQPLHPLPGAQRLHLALALPLRNREALTNLLQKIYDPASPNYRHFLKPDEFAARFGPTEQDYEVLAVFAKANGLRVTGRHPNRTLLDVNGSVSAIEASFHVKMRVYRHPTEARAFYAPDTEPSVDLSLPVLAISGLDDFFLPRPMDLRMKSFNPVPSATPLATGSGPRGFFIGNDFRAAYAPDVSWDGRGQAVGLLEFDGYYLSDITAYATLAGLSNVPLTNVFLNGVDGTPGQNNVEVALDIDMAIAMAPGLSQVIVYEGSIPNDVLNRMATDNLAAQLSSSWAFGPLTDPAREQIFQQFGAQGQSMFQASGDNGAYPSTVFPPSDDPLLTVVGGTSLTTSRPGGAWASETTWSGSGGGISTSFPIPSWQQGLNMAANQGSSSKRNLPDVACLADGVIWLVANNGDQGNISGTSASAPLWAAFTALANQQAATLGLPQIGFANPAIYTIGRADSYASSFHDISTGNNTNSSSPNRFFAVSGYDLCTGWGTPTGSNLIYALISPPVPPRISPSTAATFSGPFGGPFSPHAQTYSLTNNGTTPLAWVLANSAPWLDASPAAGTLLPGGPAAIVALSVNSAAASLPPGSYAVTLWFTNLSLQFAQSREVVLDAVTPPVITSQPASQTVLEGATATFTVSTATNALLFYQWQHDNGSYSAPLTDGDNVSGANMSTLTISNAGPSDVGAYSVLISNVAGQASSSNAFLAIVPWRPIITTQPASQSALPGQTVTLTVAAIGSQPLSYYWLRNGAPLTNGGTISGSRAPNLTLANVSSADAAVYSVVVSNSLGKTSSEPATLSLVLLTAPEANLVSLYSFTGATDGANPNGLVQIAAGTFYGTSAHGGTYDAGTVFRLTTNGTPLGLYSFTGGPDGANPFSTLALGPDLNFYGTTFQGGAFDNGSVFKITSAGNFTSLFSFNITNGSMPYAGLTLGPDSNFYGTTYKSGPAIYGTVFRITPVGHHTMLYSFANDNHGGAPYAGLLRGADGRFYGTTFKGGDFGYGTAFTISPQGNLTTLVSFDSSNGSFPYGDLVQDSDGALYATTAQGGSANNGTVFRITLSGLLTTLYSFTGGADGAQPIAGMLQGADGNFYGTTAYGGNYNVGTLFRIAPNGAFATLAQFDGYNGANPQTTLVQGADGNIYGTTQNGGAYGQGAFFRLVILGPPQITTQPASQSVFIGSNVVFSIATVGSLPLLYQWRENGTNLTDHGHLFGSASRTLMISNASLADTGAYSVVVSNILGSTNSTDAFLRVASSPPVIVLQPTNQTLAPGGTATFAVTVKGNLPLSYRWQKDQVDLSDSDHRSGSHTSTLIVTQVTEADNGYYRVVVSNSLDSVASDGALLTVVPVSAPGTRVATLHWFTGGDDGGSPNAVIQAANGMLYGTTVFGGTGRLGTVFSLATNGALTSLVSFLGDNGAIPQAALVQSTNGKLYGTTASGGSFSEGTVFEMAPNGGLSTLHSFTGALDGANSYSALVQAADGNLYGTTAHAGAHGDGTIFKLTGSGEVTNVYSFAGGSDGGSPTEGLVQGTDGHLYGMTAGGTFGHGNIYKLSLDGALTNLYSFTGGPDGSSPQGTLVQGSDGALYGTTKHNRISIFDFYGTIFRVTTNGALGTLYALNNGDGHYPAAGLIQGSDGNLYGTTFNGGASDNGTVFRVAPNGNYSTLVEFDGFDDGAHPTAALVEGLDGNLYGTTASGGLGGQGTIFRLSATAAPQITAQPVNQTALLGADVSFSVAAFGRAPLSYQWLENGTNLLVDGANLSGARSRILTLRSVSAANTGAYSVVVSNSLDSITSAPALLTIISPPQFIAVSQNGQAITLTWSAVPGQKYQLQHKSNLASTWTNLGSLITATGVTVTASDVIGPGSQQFYRVLLILQ